MYEHIRLIFFTASWCAVCRNIKPAVQSTTEQQGIRYEEVNYDNNKAMYDAYAQGIGNSLPLIVIEIGNKVFYLRFGSISIAELTDLLETAKAIPAGQYFSPVVEVVGSAVTAQGGNNTDTPEWNNEQIQIPPKKNNGIKIGLGLLIGYFVYKKLY